MDKSRVKKSILIVVLAIILYGLLWISLVGLATLIFNTISHNKTNWFLNSNLFVIAAVLWLIIVGAFGYNRFVKARGLKKNGMLSPSEFKKIGTDYLPIENASLEKGWILDFKKVSGKVTYKHLPNYNSLVYGITRAGKTTGFVLPTIYANSCSDSKPCFFITDKKDELFVKTYHFLKKQGYRIWKLDISDAINSNFWNPLSEIWNDYQRFQKSPKLSEASYIAHTSLNERVNSLLDLLFASNSHTNEAFWSESAKEFFAMIIYLNLDKGISQKELTLYELYRQFNDFSADLWIKEINSINENGLVHEHKSILVDVSKAQQTYAGIKASVIAELKFLTDATIRKISSSTNIDLKTFADKPTALFLTLPAVSSDKTKLSSIYMQNFLKLCTEIPNRQNNEECRPIYFLADEIGNIPSIAGLSDLITTGLSKRIRCMLVFQSKAQFKAKYPKDYQIIQDNCELMILIKTKDSELATNLSKAFGTREKKEKTTNRDKEGNITGSSWHTKTEPVLSPTQILELPMGKILVWLAGKKPIITNTLPIDKSKWYKNNIKEFNDKFIPEAIILNENDEPFSCVEVESKVVNKVKKPKETKLAKKPNKIKHTNRVRKDPTQPITNKEIARFRAIDKNMKKLKLAKQNKGGK